MVVVKNAQRSERPWPLQRYIFVSHARNIMQNIPYYFVYIEFYRVSQNWKRSFYRNCRFSLVRATERLATRSDTRSIHNVQSAAEPRGRPARGFVTLNANSNQKKVESRKPVRALVTFHRQFRACFLMRLLTVRVTHFACLSHLDIPRADLNASTKYAYRHLARKRASLRYVVVR